MRRLRKIMRRRRIVEKKKKSGLASENSLLQTAFLQGEPNGCGLSIGLDVFLVFVPDAAGRNRRGAVRSTAINQNKAIFYHKKASEKTKNCVY